MSDFADALLRERFVGAMARAASGVAIVSSTIAGQPFAVTVSSFNSVSADPPMMLVCINRRSPVASAIDASGHFVVNLLSTQQTLIAEIFAGRAEPCFDFACARWTGLEGEKAPRLVPAVASFGCETEQCVDAGSHRLFIGRVVDVEVEVSDLPPLLYTSRQFARPCALGDG